MRILRGVILVLWLPSCVAANEAEVIERPPTYRVGDAWTYQRTAVLHLDQSRPRLIRYTDTVTEISADGITIRSGRVGGAPGARPRLHTAELNVIDDGEIRYTPFVALREFPLRPGKSWHVSLSEDRRYHPRDGGRYGRLLRQCWSPEVRWFVRMEYYLRWAANPTLHDLYELVAFKPTE